jgi:hypothetical protein
MAEAVVELAGLGLREHFVGLGDLPEALLGVGRVAHVRVQLAREPPERLLDVGIGRRARHTEDLVVVALRRRHSSERSAGRGRRSGGGQFVS